MCIRERDKIIEIGAVKVRGRKVIDTYGTPVSYTHLDVYKRQNGMSVLMGVIILAVGIWFLVQPAVIVSLIPIVIGVVLLFHGFRAIKETIEAKKCGYDAWGANLILAIISLICGFICVFDAFGVMEKATIVVGIILIYNGVSNIWISSSATRAAKDYARRNATVDVNFVEDDDDK